MRTIPIIKIEQPIGIFYVSAMKSEDIYGIARIRNRRLYEDAVQRDPAKDRISEICDYCSDEDATFPTPIIISIYSEANVNIIGGQLTYDESEPIGEVIDGQHRLLGIIKSEFASRFELPVIFMVGLNNEEKAYVFSIINSKQTKVNSSLIFDLFGMSFSRSPQKTVHELARSMNGNKKSPFFQRLKMLGTKNPEQKDAVLSQGTFANSIIKLISKNPVEDSRILRRGLKIDYDKSLPLRIYFIKERDDMILKILLNCFNALKSVFSEEWENPRENILWKTTGFGAIVYSLRQLLPLGIENRNLTEKYFYHCFIAFKEKLTQDGKKLTSVYFGSGEQSQKRLAEIIVEAVNSKQIEWLFNED